MDSILMAFSREFTASFHAPCPYRGKPGTNWLVSKVWSEYMRGWLRSHYHVRFEYPLPNRRRLDAALWSITEADCPPQGKMDIALEWEWDNTKVARDYLSGDFRKLLDVDAQCGLAIVQTRADGRRGSMQADETVRQLQDLYGKHRRDSRSVALIEIRRVFHQNERVDFVCYFQDLCTSTMQETDGWSYP